MRIFTIPNAITSMNLVCGILGVIAALGGALDMALLLMMLAAVFDFFDGLAARLLHSVSPIGKELDSLSDMVSFGVLPSLMLLSAMQHGGNSSWASYLPLFLAVMSAYRLAKFNIDERQSSDFLGLPTPAAALLSGSLAYYVAASPGSLMASWAASAWFLPLVAVVLGVLLVSEVPMFSMKVAKGHKLLDAKRICFLALAAAAIVLTIVLKENAALAVLLIFCVYILENLLLSALPAKK